ncbi:MAG: SMI1/KNR4 family protein [Flavobacterium sp.]|uniref:SMI1/KNR4 family protein n=1 Tax=Flavobacterium sp. TaxID=239 RepID=UPI003BD13EEB
MPVSVSSLVDLKTQFGLIDLPNELEELYRQTNGICELSNGQEFGELIWTMDRVIETNKDYLSDSNYKSIYMSFNQLFFFSDA